MTGNDGWRGIDLDEELESDATGREYTDVDDELLDEDDGVGKKKKCSKGKRFDFAGVVEFVKRPAVWISTIVVFILVILLMWFLGRGGGSTNNAANNGTTQSSVTNKNGLSKNTYEIFTNGIKHALNANDVKNQVASEWRKATIKYGETNDREEFQAALVKANDTRKKGLEAIPEDDYQINKYMIDTLNAQREYLNKAYEAKSSEDATNIYNDWRNNVNVQRDNEYIEILIAELDKVGIPYEKTENDGKLQVTF